MRRRLGDLKVEKGRLGRDNQRFLVREDVARVQRNQGV